MESEIGPAKATSPNYSRPHYAECLGHHRAANPPISWKTTIVQQIDRLLDQGFTVDGCQP